MKFGVMCHPHWPAGMTQLQAYDEGMSLITDGEKLGFDSAWVTEHHFGSDPDYVPFGLEGPFPAYDLIADPLTFLAAAAGKTSKIRLGTAVLVTHYDDPIRMAERAAMVDLLSHGRLNLGVGRGGGVWEPKAFGVPIEQADNQDRFFEALDIFRKAWTGKRFQHEGKFYSYPEVSVVPSPMQKKLPVLLSNRNKRSVEYAAKHGLSYLAVTASWGLGGIDTHNEFHDVFEKTSAENGHLTSGLEFPQTLFTYVAPTDAEAEDMAYRSMLNFRGFGESHYQHRRFNGDTVAPPIGGNAIGRAASLDIRETFKQQLESNLIGSPKTVAEKLTMLREKMPSMNHIIAVLTSGAPPHAFTQRSMQLLATEVMPHFKDTEALVA